MKKFYKTISIFILLILLLANISFADDVDTDTEPTYEEIMKDVDTAIVSAVPDETPQISSRSAVIFDRDSGQFIWGKKEDLKVPMASTTNVISYQR